MEYDAALYEVFEEEEELLREHLPSDLRCYFTRNTIQDEGHESPLARLISIRTQSRIPFTWGEQTGGIFTRSTGYDHLVQYRNAIAHDVRTGYLPRYASRAVAEHMFMLMLMLLRKVDEQRRAVKTFSRDGLTGSELEGKHLSVIGVGNIGSEVVKIGAGFGMNLCGVDLVERREMVRKFDLQYLALEESVEKADIIACCLPLTDDTEGLLNYDLLSCASRGTILINAARGEITPPGDLTRLLEEGRLSGLGLDVYDEESLLASYLRGHLELEEIETPAERSSLKATLRLFDHPSVIVTPHNAFNTVESTRRKARRTAENIRHYQDQGEFLTPVP